MTLRAGDKVTIFIEVEIDKIINTKGRREIFLTPAVYSIDLQEQVVKADNR